MALSAFARIEEVVARHLAPPLRNAGFRRVGSNFIRKVDDALTQVVQVRPTRTRIGSFQIEVGITSAPVVYLWTGRRERSRAQVSDFLETWPAHEITGEPRHREFMSDDPAIGDLLARAAEKITAALRREPYRSFNAVLRRSKWPPQQAAILAHLGRGDEAKQLLEREIAREKNPPVLASLAAELRRLENVQR